LSAVSDERALKFSRLIDLNRYPRLGHPPNDPVADWEPAQEVRQNVYFGTSKKQVRLYRISRRKPCTCVQISCESWSTIYVEQCSALVNRHTSRDITRISLRRSYSCRISGLQLSSISNSAINFASSSNLLTVARARPSFAASKRQYLHFCTSKASKARKIENLCCEEHQALFIRFVEISQDRCVARRSPACACGARHACQSGPAIF
jgi:hypothetical protein